MMQSLGDSNGDRTLHKGVAWAVSMVLLPFCSCYAGFTSSMFLVHFLPIRSAERSCVVCDVVLMLLNVDEAHDTVKPTRPSALRLTLTGDGDSDERLSSPPLRVPTERSTHRSVALF